jgi:hypothetical protein
MMIDKGKKKKKCTWGEETVKVIIMWGWVGIPHALLLLTTSHVVRNA